MTLGHTTQIARATVIGLLGTKRKATSRAFDGERTVRGKNTL
jgi:hypothetical protein